MKGIGIESRYSAPLMKDLKDMCDNTDLVVIFTDESSVKAADAYVYIKDYCFEKDKQIIVVGAKTEYDAIKGYITEGLVFKFYERPLDMERLVNDIEQYMEEESQLARRKSILIVDDDVSYMSMIMEWLKEKYRVSLANSGMEAITWLAGNTPDLILLDYEMPITPGPQVLQMIQSSVKTADIPVIFLTGKSDRDSILSVLALKPAGYLLKSIGKDGLNKELAEFFAKKKSERVS